MEKTGRGKDVPNARNDGEGMWQKSLGLGCECCISIRKDDPYNYNHKIISNDNIRKA
jgi:hypothetical protein